MDNEDRNWIEIDQYNSITLDDYNGKLSIITGNKGQNDVMYTKWCAPQVYRNGEKKILEKDGKTVFVPWGISLGKEPQKAMDAVGKIYHMLKRICESRQ